MTAATVPASGSASRSTTLRVVPPSQEGEDKKRAAGSLRRL